MSFPWIKRLLSPKKIFSSILHFVIWYTFVPLFCAVLTIPLVFILCGSIIGAGIGRYFLSLFLKFRYGSDFGGMMRGRDAFLASDDKRAKSLVCAFKVLEFQGTFEDFYQKVRKILIESVNNDRDIYPKPLAIKRTFWGLYHFYQYNQVNLDECIKIVNVPGEVLDEDGLQKILSHHYHADLPKNDKALIEILFLNKPMDWLNRNDGKPHYVIVFRAHHSLLDGIAAMRIAVEKLSDEKPSRNQFEFLAKDEEILSFWETVKQYGDKTLKLIAILLALPTMMILELIKKGDRNPLHGKKLSGEKILVWDVEPTRKYLKMVKETKNRIPDIKFSEVILTAFSESLHQYFKQATKNKDDIPKYITSFVPSYPKTKKIRQQNLYLNHFVLVRIQMPISKCSSSLIDKLNWIHAEVRRVERSLLSAVTIFTIRTIFTYIPIPFIKLFSIYPVTLTFSSVPGMDSLRYAGQKLEDFVCFTQHRGNIGVSLVIVTYDGRFQLGLNVDKALISDVKDAKSILNNFWKCLDGLHQAAYEKDYKQDPILQEKYTIFMA